MARPRFKCVLRKQAQHRSEEPKNSKCEKINDNNDYFIEWENETDKKIYKRYYHRFTKDEFFKLFNFDNLKIINYYEEHNNLICIIQKIEI